MRTGRPVLSFKMLTGQTDRLRQLFADQFETVGADIFFRKNSKGPPIRVSAEERDAFVAAYRRSIFWSYGLLIFGMIAGTAGLIFYVMRSGSDFPQISTYLGLGLLLALSVAIQLHAWHAPARALRYRMTAGASRSPEEMRRMFFERLTWSRLGGLAVVAAVIPLNAARHADILHGWGRLWLVASAALWVLLAVQAFRKWRYDAAKKRSAGETL